MTNKIIPYATIIITEYEGTGWMGAHTFFTLKGIRYTHGRVTKGAKFNSLAEVIDYLCGLKAKGYMNQNTRITCTLADETDLPLETDADWVIAKLQYGGHQND